MEGHKHIHVRRHVHFNTHTHIHIHICIYMLVEEGEEGGDKPNHVTTNFPFAVSLRIAETEQLYQAQRMIGGLGNVLLSRPVLKLKMGKILLFPW